MRTQSHLRGDVGKVRDVRDHFGFESVYLTQKVRERTRIKFL